LHITRGLEMGYGGMARGAKGKGGKGGSWGKGQGKGAKGSRKGGSAWGGRMVRKTIGGGGAQGRKGAGKGKARFDKGKGKGKGKTGRFSRKGKGKGKGRGKGKGKGGDSKEYLDKQLEAYMGPDAIKASLDLELDTYFKGAAKVIADGVEAAAAAPTAAATA